MNGEAWSAGWSSCWLLLVAVLFDALGEQLQRLALLAAAVLAVGADESEIDERLEPVGG
jgi:hypothetical protein